MTYPADEAILHRFPGPDASPAPYTVSLSEDEIPPPQRQKTGRVGLRRREEWEQHCESAAESLSAAFDCAPEDVEGDIMRLLDEVSALLSPRNG